MFFVLFLKLINKVVEGSKYANSFWFNALAVLCPYLVYKAVTAIMYSITTASSIINMFSGFSNLM